jgi:hypothetical protein
MRRRADGERGGRRTRGAGADLDARLMHADPEAAMREIRRLRAAAQEARPEP